MSDSSVLRTEVDGEPVPAGYARLSALTAFGHFTALQVRGGAVRGLGLHLARLARANEELFGEPLDEDLVRSQVRHALAGGGVAASVRVAFVRPAPGEAVGMVVTAREPADQPNSPQSLQSVAYQRPVAHIKQVGGGFGQSYFGAAARRAGFDDALLTGLGGVVAEAAIANIAFFDGTGLVWPDAPCLEGITMQLLESDAHGTDLKSRRAPIRLADLASFGGAVVTNARGIAPVGRIDDVDLPIDPALVESVARAYRSVPWDVI